MGILEKQGWILGVDQWAGPLNVVLPGRMGSLFKAEISQSVIDTVKPV